MSSKFSKCWTCLLKKLPKRFNYQTQLTQLIQFIIWSHLFLCFRKDGDKVVRKHTFSSPNLSSPPARFSCVLLENKFQKVAWWQHFRWSNCGLFFFFFFFFFKKRKHIFMMMKSLCCSREEERCKMALELKRFKKELQLKKKQQIWSLNNHFSNVTTRWW